MTTRFLKHTALAALMAAPAASLYAGQLDQIRASGAVTLAHREASIPFSYLDADKQAVGYSMDLCLKLVQAIRQELKLPTLQVKYLAVTSATRMTAIAQGQATMECGSTTNTAERRQQVDYTIAHFISAARFLVRSGSGLTSLTSLAGKTVTSTQGTTNLKTLERLNAEYALGMKLVSAPDHAQAFNLVATGKADAFAMDDVLLYGLRANADRPEAFEPRFSIRRTCGAVWIPTAHLRPFSPLFVTHGTGHGLLSRTKTDSQLHPLSLQTLMEILG